VSQLVTGEAVALDLRPAGLPSRVVAGLLDGLIVFTVLVVISGLATAVSFDVSEAAAQALGILVIVVVLIGYPVTFETLMRGRTPGKAAMGLRVVRDDGGPIGFRQALVRGLFGAFLERPGITLFLGAVVTTVINGQGKRLGDLFAGTVVLRERVTVHGGASAVMPRQLIPWASQLDLSGVPDGLLLSLRQFISRADAMSPVAREDLGGRLVRAVTEHVGPPPPGTPGWAVVHAVVAERRRRESERYAGRGPGGGQRYAPPPPSYAPPAPYGPPAPGTRPGQYALPGQHARPAPDAQPEQYTPPATVPPTSGSAPPEGRGGFAVPS